MASSTSCGVPSKTRVLVVDDHAVVRSSLIRLINEESDLVVCGEAEDERQALAAAEKLQADVAVVDWSLRDKDASELIATLSEHHPQMPVLVLSVHEEQYYAGPAIRAGARGYVMKQEATEKIIAAIRCVATGQTWLSNQAASAVSTTSPDEWPADKVALLKTLTETETDALKLVANGYSSSRIAERLGLRLKDFNTLRENLRTKLRLRSTAELFQTAPRWLAEAHRIERKS